MISLNISQEKFQLSPFVRIIRSKKGVILYHSLFSKPLFGNEDIVTILQFFHTPKPISALLKKYDFNVDISNVITAFINHFFLIRPGFDERAFISDRVRQYLNILKNKPQLRHLELLVSENCNLACKHCIHFKAIKTGRRKLNPLMKWDVAKYAVDKYMSVVQRYHLSECRIHFGGAEPFLNWPLIEKIINYSNSKWRFLNPQFSITSNLILLTRTMAKKLRDYSVLIGTSIDGNKKANDVVRMTVQGKGTFDIIMKKFRILSDIDYPIKAVNITLADNNFYLIDTSIIDHLYKLGVTEITMDVDLVNKLSVSVDESLKKLFALRKRCSELGINGAGTWMKPFLNLINRSILNNDDLPSFCKVIKGTNISVAPDGKLYICPYTSTSVGLLHNFDTILLDAKGPFIQMINSRLIGQNQVCLNCEIEGQCVGQCHVTYENSLPSPNGKFYLMCSLYREATRVLLIEKLNREM